MCCNRDKVLIKNMHIYFSYVISRVNNSGLVYFIKCLALVGEKNSFVANTRTYRKTSILSKLCDRFDRTQNRYSCNILCVFVMRKCYYTLPKSCQQ